MDSSSEPDLVVSCIAALVPRSWSLCIPRECSKHKPHLVPREVRHHREKSPGVRNSFVKNQTKERAHTGNCDPLCLLASK
eukprot:1453985-Pyramimonas_sp.AAC.1